MAVEIHGEMKYADYFNSISFDAKKDHVLTETCRTTVLKQISPQLKAFRTLSNFFKPIPETVQISDFLFLSPSLKSVVSNGLNVGESSRRENQLYHLPRTRAMNSFLSAMVTPSPRFN